MHPLRPSQWIVLLGAAVVVGAALLDDGGRSAGGAEPVVGLLPAALGLFALVATIEAATGARVRPAAVLSFTVDQLVLVAALTAVLVAVGGLFTTTWSGLVTAGSGTWLSAAGSVVLFVGAVMEQEGTTTRRPHRGRSA